MASQSDGALKYIEYDCRWCVHFHFYLIRFLLSSLDISQEIIQKRDRHHFSSIPVPPAQMKYLEAAQHLFVNDQHNDEYWNVLKYAASSCQWLQRNIPRLHLDQFAELWIRKMYGCKKWHVIIVTRKFYIIQFLLFVAWPIIQIILIIFSFEWWIKQ